MSRAERREKHERELASIEADFRRELLDGLRDGRWGFFGGYDDLGPHFFNASRVRLLKMLETIDAIRSELGYADPFALGRRYREYAAMRGSNTPGEPKLAAQFLEELGES